MRFLLLAIIVVTMSSLAWGAEADKGATGSDAEAAKQTSEQSREQPDEPPAPKPQNNREIFVPSEEISEDFAVSLPVDI